jgi:hypothetical protein
LTDEKKVEKVSFSRESLGYFEEEGEGFLLKIVEGDEISSL